MARGRQLAWDLYHDPIDQPAIDALVAEMRRVYHRDDRPWVAGYSGGKDSTCVVQLTHRMLMAMSPAERSKTVYVVSADTLVENPRVADWLDRCHDELRRVADEYTLPVEVVKVTPNPAESFWVLLLGRGYPAPTQAFRWCTGRLKIDPAEAWIRAHISENGRILQLLGSRKKESRSRAASIERHALEGKFGSTGSLTEGMSYQPIQDWDNDNVWEFLNLFPKPWGGDNQELFALYQDAHGGECVLDFDKRTPSCGDSRFGCWTCTVVEADRSLGNMVDLTNPELAALVEFRNKIRRYRMDRSKRDPIGRNGRIRLHSKTGEVTPGPYLLEVRAELLADLFRIEREMQAHIPGWRTVTDTDLHWIRHWWEHDGGDPGLVDRLRMEVPAGD